MHWPTAAVAVVLFALAVQHPASAQYSNDELVSPLRAGGFVIVFRHGLTDEYPEQPGVDPNDCRRQRNLSAAGRAQAGAVGRAMALLGIQVDRVVTSLFCRCQDTARAAFGRAQPAYDVVDGADLAALRLRYGAPPRPGANDVIVGHGSAGGMVGDEHLDYLEAVIVRPLDHGRFQLLARVRADWWSGIVSRSRR